MIESNIQEDIVFVVIQKDQEVPPNLENIVVTNVMSEIKSGLQLGKAYVRYRSYLGLSSTGSFPWITTIHQGDHQVAYSSHESTHQAVEAARQFNRPAEEGSRRPAGLMNLFKKRDSY